MDNLKKVEFLVILFAQDTYAQACESYWKRVAIFLIGCDDEPVVARSPEDDLRTKGPGQTATKALPTDSDKSHVGESSGMSIFDLVQDPLEGGGD